MKKGIAKARRGAILLGTLFAFSMWLVPNSYGSEKPPDWKTIQQRMQEIINFIDSAMYAELASWDEHVVLAYRLTQVREPEPFELFLARELRDEIGLSRSTLLSIALRGKSRRTTWAQCRAFLSRTAISDFRVDSKARDVAQRLSTAPLSEIVETLKRAAKRAPRDPRSTEEPLTISAPKVRYQTFFGYLHAHSKLSDGKGSPSRAYTYAHVRGKLDFFALTDHGEELDIWPWENEWESLVDAADALYEPDRYVTLYGFEWSSPIYGHINILNTADYTDALANLSITQLYDWLRDRPRGFGRFNHPGEYDYFSTEFSHLELNPEAVPQMVGIETWNGNKSFDQYYYKGSWESKYSYWDEGNRKGWYLGALGGQDNHERNWGRLNDFRVAVLAKRLTRKQIINAYLNRRFYVTEDKDLYLDLRCQGYPMGSRLSGVRRKFIVKARDESGDTFKQVRLYRNGKLIKKKAVSGNNIRVRFTDGSRSGGDYYYVVVRQRDDNDGNGRKDEAMSSPIWID